MKKIFIIIAIFIITFILIQNEIGKKDSKINFIKSKIPENIKTILNETVFVFKNQENLKKQLKNEQKNNENNLQNLNEIPILLGYIPFYKINGEQKLKFENKNFKLKKFKTNILNVAKYKNAKGTSYLEIYNNNLILVNANGIFSYFDKKNFYSSEFKSKIIESNIKELVKYKDFYLNSRYGIKDVLIDSKENIFISLTYELNKDCYNTSIFKAKINFNFLNFEKFFIPDECVKIDNEYGEYSAFHAGGRILDNEKDLIFSTGEFRYRTHAQNLNNLFGKIITIDKNTKDFNIVASGLRNSQGLFYNKDKDILFITEHGPKGGDEINIKKSLYGKISNFGWPISSYGEHYPHETEQKTKSIYLKAPLHKSHKEYGFEEPLIYYNPGVAPSEIIELNNKFLKNHSNTNLLMGTMGKNVDEGDRSLHLISLDENLKIKKSQIIPLNERVRDMIYDELNNQIILFLETSSTIGVISIIK